MLVGIDVGGTNTDLVALEQGFLVKKVKVRHENNIAKSIFEALGKAFPKGDLGLVSNLNISTTFVTNLLAQANLPPLILIQIPGLGLPSPASTLATKTFTLKGSIDHQGKVIEDLDLKELKDLKKKLEDEKFNTIAVVGKFSCRNNSQELAVGNFLTDLLGPCKIYYGHKIAGRLNFPRRIASTLVHGGVIEPYRDFLTDVEDTLRNLGYQGPINILLGDGSTIPLKRAIASPIDSLYSGPAATLLGAKALLPKDKSALVMDVGGTTTDLGLILQGDPLESPRGIPIDGGFLQGRSFLTYSVPIGGNTPIQIDKGILKFNYNISRKPAYLGGDNFTVTDLLCLLDKRGLTEANRLAYSNNLLERLAEENKLSPNELLNRALELLLEILQNKLEEIQLLWEREPAYHLWKVLRKENLAFPNLIIAMGEAAPTLADNLGKVLGIKVIVPREYGVTNALGAALAQSAFRLSLRVDTSSGTYQMAELGEQGAINNPTLNLEEALNMAINKLSEIASKEGKKVIPDEVEVIEKEVFNIVKQGVLKGRIIQVEVRTPWALTPYQKEVLDCD